MRKTHRLRAARQKKKAEGDRGMRKKKAVLFDFDGTVMDTNEIIVESWQHAFRRIRGHTVDPSILYPTFGEPLADTVQTFFPDCEPKRAIDIYREYQQNIWDKPIHMFPGMRELLLGLKGRGVKIAMVTSRVWSSARLGVYHFDIADLFDAVVSAEDTDVHKPDPYPALLCLQKLGLGAGEVLMVGDSKYDVLCGKNAGIETVLVDWSLCLPREKRVGDCKPDYVIEKPEDLYALVGVEKP